MAIDDLTSQLTMLKELGQPDLQLSERARDDYTRLISTYRSVLIEQRDRITELANLGGTVGYLSAQETQRRLELNATGLDGIQESLDSYIGYLDAFEDTVNAAFERIQGEDQA